MNEPETITINEIEYIRADSAPKYPTPEGDFSPWEIGQEYFIQTVTHYYLGRLVLIGEVELTIDNASWVADTGRFHKFISGTNPKENEPYPMSQLVIIGRGSIISATRRESFIEVVS